MREIKFRCWDEDLGMLDCYCLQDNDATLVMQYTGLKDKNDKEIYEGDILKIHSDTVIVKFGVFDNGEKYDDNESGCGFYLEKKDKSIRNLYPFLEYEVIGNIFENQ